nr:proline-rich membrane anchor 1 isoform X2 [Camelus dromedarius]
METRNHCSGAGGGGGERGRERSSGREAGEALAPLTSVFLFRALFISPPPATLRPERALLASDSSCCFPRAGVTGGESSGTPAPRAAARRHREGRGPGEGTRCRLQAAEGDFPRPPPPPRQPAPAWARGCRLSRPARGRVKPAPPCPAPHASAPCSGPRLSRPGGPSRAQTFASVPGAPPRHVKPPGARAVARVTHGEPQKSCSKVTDSCQHICQCRPPPPLLPPTPAPAAPQTSSAPAPNATSCPTEESWWSGLVIIIAVCCASLVFLTVLVIICYKAIKRNQAM